MKKIFLIILFLVNFISFSMENNMYEFRSNNEKYIIIFQDNDNIILLLPNNEKIFLQKYNNEFIDYDGAYKVKKDLKTIELYDGTRINLELKNVKTTVAPLKKGRNGCNKVCTLNIE